MSSDVDICNLALSHLGDEAEVVAIDPPDGSIQSAHCGRFYPIARDLLLEMHPWTFAVKRVTLAAVTNPAATDWSYAYALPSTCIKPLAAVTPGTAVQSFDNTEQGAHPYMVETASDGSLVLLTNVNTAKLRYIDTVTDTSKFTPGFVAALGRLLASMLAGPMIKGEAGEKVAQTQRQAFDVEFTEAAKRNTGISNRGLRREAQDPETATTAAIANLALSYLGDAADVVSLADNSMQAAQAKQFYPVARNQLLEMFPWSFAIKRATLVVATNPYEEDWSYAYTLPATCLRPLSALSPGTPERYLSTDADIGTFPYLIETSTLGAMVLYTNVETATLRYIDKITDATKFTPGFTTALARLLASYLAGPIVKGEKGAAMSQSQMKLFDMEYRRAAAADANRGKRDAYEQRVPPHVAARGGFTSIPDATITRP